MSSISTSELQTFIDAPAQLLQQSQELQLAIASYPDTPRSLLEMLVSSPSEEVAEAARLHVNYAGEAGENWQQLVDDILTSRQLGQNDRLAVELLKIAPVPPNFLSEWVPANNLIQGLRNQYMPLRYRLKLLERLALQPSLEPRLQVAESPETPLAVLEQLAGDLELAVRLAVKFNPSCPPALIELVEGQYAVASDWNADIEQLAMLGQSRWAWIRLAVAQNPSTPAQTLTQLATDTVLAIQLAVAQNPGTPAAVLELLAKHPEQAIQEAVVDHPNATEEILHLLFKPQQYRIKQQENLPVSILERFFREATETPIWQDINLRSLLLRQANTPAWILARLADVDLAGFKAEKLATGHPELWIKNNLSFLADIAKHPQVSVEILERLSQYPDSNVQLAVAQNPLTPLDLKLRLLEDLSIDPDPEIQVKVARDVNTPVQILESAQNELYQEKLLREIRRVLASEYPVNSHSFQSTADAIMSQLKHEVFYPANISIDVDRWIEIIGGSDSLKLIATGSSSRTSTLSQMLLSYLASQWGELLESLPKNLRDRAVSNIFHILELINDEVKNNQYVRSVAVALVGNPSTPVALRNQLQNQLTQPVDRWGYYSNDLDMRLALACNPAVPKPERLEYYQQILSRCGSGTKEQIARHPNTPLEILEQFMATPGSARQAVSRNPNAPATALAELAQDSNSATRGWVAENPSTPVEVLVQLASQPVDKTNNDSTIETVLKNPKFPLLERYRLLLTRQQKQETAKAHELMARRTDSPYAMLQVLEKGDRNAKLTAARSNKTPIQVLEQLAKDTDETVRQVVLQNPNLPLHSLLELAKDESVNVRLWLAYNSSPHKTQKPVQLLEQLAQDASEQVRARVAGLSETPVDILVRLANDSSRDVKVAVTGNPNTPVTVLTRLGLEEDIVNQRNPNTPGMVLNQAVNTMNGESLANFIKHPVKGSQMPGETLARLVTHSNSSVRYRVADHPNTPIEALEPLLNDSYGPVLWAIAGRADIPPHYLERLLREKDKNSQDYEQIAIRICDRAVIPPNLLETLMESHQERVYRRVAAQPNLPEAILEKLLATSSDSVLTTLAANKTLSSEFLARLANLPSPNVCRAIIHHPNMTSQLWEKLVQSPDASVRMAIATNSSTPVNILEILASDLEQDVRAKIASNSSSPIRILTQLAQDEDALVRTAVASNPNLSDTILTQLAQDRKVEVRRAVAQNPHTPASIRETLQELLSPPQTKQTSPTLRGLPRLYNPQTDDLATILTEYARSPNAFVRFVTLLHPLTPSEILQQGATSISWLERYAVAENSATAIELRSLLAQDSNRIVRAVANANLSA
ncbi:hypothetical protein UH38_06670 [Aliterella atlantica CENA595]|uniref:Leucine rich repeat variant n=1 Tax=Aliterella atlantica CENA595 TaxID=1618023 RepID=A0A0D8ZVP8_9CYAN|nr:hypothetical protein UH38_06670 [Aliterella atlantica CENA595]